MSLLGKKWVIQNKNEDIDIVEKLLLNRGIDSPEKAKWFFNGQMKDLHCPTLLTDIGKGVARIRQAVEKQEKIMIFGDYDADGITATAILYDFLKKIGANVHYTLPHREEDGYGLKDYFIKRFKEQDITLIVTVDCGTSNLKEIELANELGIDVIVTDHHSMPKQLPPAYAIINPKRPDCNYPNKEISGSSIAYKLVTALAPHYFSDEIVEQYLGELLGLVALGVVGDCMSLTGENRILVREGLKSLMAGHSPGVLALMKEADISTDRITSTTIGFQIAPRINAAGRLDHPSHAFELLIGNLEKAMMLNQLNEKRREIAQKYIKEAIAKIEQLDEIPNIIILKDKNWRAGLLGLIASDISEKYGRPTIVMQEKDDEIIGSMRSVNDFDITHYIRGAASDLFTAFGGHAMAGGFTMLKENLEEFIKRAEEVGKNEINPAEFVSTLNIDCEIQPDELSFETCNRISRLEPFGSGNPQPTLLVKNAQILKVKLVGKNAEHLQFPIQHGDKTVGAIAFRFGGYLDKIDVTKPHDIVCSLEINEWNGYRKLQMRVMDLKPSE